MTDATAPRKVTAAALALSLALFSALPAGAVEAQAGPESVPSLDAPIAPSAGLAGIGAVSVEAPQASALSVPGAAELALPALPAASAAAAAATAEAAVSPAAQIPAAAPASPARVAPSAAAGPARASASRRRSAREALERLAPLARGDAQPFSASVFDGEAPARYAAGSRGGEDADGPRGGSGSNGSNRSGGSDGSGGSQIPARAAVLELNDAVLPGATMKYRVPAESPVGKIYRRLAAQNGGGVVAVTDGDGSTGRHYPVATYARVSVEIQGEDVVASVKGVKEVRVAGYSKDGGEAVISPIPLRRDVESEQHMMEMIHELTHVLEHERGFQAVYKTMHHYLDNVGLDFDTAVPMTNRMLGDLRLPQETLQGALGSMSLPVRLQLVYETMHEAAEKSGALDRWAAQQEQEAARQAARRGRQAARPNGRQAAASEDEEEQDPALQKIKERFAQEKDAMNEEARAAVERELGRLNGMNPQAAEYHVILDYLTWLVEVPWKEQTKDNTDLAAAQKTLDDDHYGLQKVKERIVEFLAVRQANPDRKGAILVLDGPPGVGKTSLGKSIAKALGRKFARISMGGKSDEADIRGHRRTYVGAMPGEIIKTMRQVGVINPVLLIDEVDKLGKADGGGAVKGDPQAAMLEVLDPEQNHTFRDNYMDVPYDLSKVFFMGTSNDMDKITGPLRDRMEIIHLSSYIEDEKLAIAKRHLVPKELKENGFAPGEVTFTDAALRSLISSYTRESGVRNLERRLGEVLSKLQARKMLGKPWIKTVDAKDLKDILGNPRFNGDHKIENGVGKATGLYWSQTGGGVLLIETAVAPHSASEPPFSLTGQIADVMKESASLARKNAMRWALKHGANQRAIESWDVSMHIPDGATPKDGPSAGITMTTALASLYTGRAVRPGVAMTGEITLGGEVWPIGGLKEKAIGALKAGYKEIIISKDNENDLEDLPPEVRNHLVFHAVRTIDEVLDIALEKNGTPLGSAVSSEPRNPIGFHRPSEGR